MLQFNDEGNLEALHEGKEIGLFEFSMDDDDPTGTWELWHMNVDKSYQKSGIGATMMQFAVKELEWFILPKPAHFVNAPNYLAGEGAKLVNHCFRNGILPPGFHGQYDLY